MQPTDRLKQFLRARLTRERFLGLHFTLGVLVLVGATWLFGAIAEDVVHGDAITLTDVRFSNWIHNHATPAMTTAMLIVSGIHNSIGTTIITLSVIIWLVRRRLIYWAIAFAISVYGGMLLNVLLKNIFHRARPHFDNPILTLNSYGFPSGHTMMATTLYGALCAFVFFEVHNWIWRTIAVCSATIIIALVAFSRIYLGAHYLTDVVAASVEGLFWLALCLTVSDTKRRWEREVRTNLGR